MNPGSNNQPIYPIILGKWIFHQNSTVTFAYFVMYIIRYNYHQKKLLNRFREKFKKDDFEPKNDLFP